MLNLNTLCHQKLITENQVDSFLCSNKWKRDKDIFLTYFASLLVYCVYGDSSGIIQIFSFESFKYPHD